MVFVTEVNIKHTKGTNETIIFIMAEFFFDQSEIDANVLFHLTIEIKGHDFCQGTEKDEILAHTKEEFHLNKEIISKLNYNKVYQFQRAIVVDTPVLDEDKGRDEDEIYVQIKLKPISIQGEEAQALSNLITDHFERK